MLREELSGSRDALGKTRGRLAEAIAAGLAKRAGGGAGDEGGAPLVALLEDAPLELLRSIATRLTAEPGVVAVLGGRTPEGVTVLVAKNATSTVDCGALLKRLATAAGGRGGGRKEHAEGKLPPGADFEGAARAAIEG